MTLFNAYALHISSSGEAWARQKKAGQQVAHLPLFWAWGGSQPQLIFRSQFTISQCLLGARALVDSGLYIHGSDPGQTWLITTYYGYTYNTLYFTFILKKKSPKIKALVSLNSLRLFLLPLSLQIRLAHLWTFSLDFSFSLSVANSAH